MLYTKRRIVRYRIMRRTAIIRTIKAVVTSIKDFIPELISAIALLLVLFYILPLLFGGMAAASGVIL